MSETFEIKCARCNVPVEGPANAHAGTVISCPVCGISDTKENVEQEAADYATQQAADALNASLEKATRGNKFITFEEGARDTRVYRFIVDYKPDF